MKKSYIKLIRLIKQLFSVFKADCYIHYYLDIIYFIIICFFHKKQGGKRVPSFSLKNGILKISNVYICCR